jgi:hypothetical protein
MTIAYNDIFKIEVKKKCAHDWIRTSTPYGTTPSRWRVYQFHHVGIFTANIGYFSFQKSTDIN